MNNMRRRQLQRGGEQQAALQQPEPLPPPVILGLPNDLGTRVSYLRLPSRNDTDDFGLEGWPGEYKEVIMRMRTKVGTRFHEELGDIVLLPGRGGEGEEVHQLVLYTTDVADGANGFWLILYFRIGDLYLVGFRNPHGKFQFKDENYDGTKLGFNGSYGELSSTSGYKISTVMLGKYRLESVMNNLFRVGGNEPISDEDIATALFVATLMFAEALRFQFLMTLFETDSSGFIRISLEQAYYLNHWSNGSKVLIAAKERPESIGQINAVLASGRLRFPLLGGRPGEFLPTVEGMQAIIRVVSNQDVGDSLRLVGLVV